MAKASRNGGDGRRGGGVGGVRKAEEEGELEAFNQFTFLRRLRAARATPVAGKAEHDDPASLKVLPSWSLPSMFGAALPIVKPYRSKNPALASTIAPGQTLEVDASRAISCTLVNSITFQFIYCL
jgi:hypothetical protein